LLAQEDLAALYHHSMAFPPSNSSDIIGLLLAAGKSTRFIDASGVQRDKLGVTLPRSDPPETVIRRSARSLLAACPQSIAVLKPESPHALTMQDLGLSVVIAERAAHGMGESLAAGARAALAQEASGVIIMLADLPYVKTETIQAVADALRSGAPIAVPRYQGEQGHPVGFAAKHLPALAELTGDVGARAIIKQHAYEITYLELDNKGILSDVDTNSDLIMFANASKLV
jgi:molybdenum cofactor cytidylyltransferase